MKKRFFSLLCCAVMLCALSAAAEEGAAYADAFSGAKELALVESGAAYPGTQLISLSPDGQTALVRTESGLALIRNGQALPVKAAKDRGVGDPYGKLDKNLEMLARYLPGREGVAWSQDGRYAALTHKTQSLQNMRSPDLTVLDAETGEAFLAAAFSAKAIDENGGLVFEAKFDRSGKYLYFTGRLNAKGGAYSLYRCDMTTYEIETVQTGLDPVIASGLYETPDGRWLVLGVTGTSRTDRQSISICQAADTAGVGLFKALTARIQAADALKYQSKLPYMMLSADFLPYSSQSGYGLMICHTPLAVSESTPDLQKSLITLLSAMNLIRITPREPETERMWMLRSTAADFSDLRAETVDSTAAELVQKAAQGGLTQEEEEIVKGYAGLVQRGLLYVSCGCVSPDGRYALLNVCRDDQSCLALLDMETMALRRVEAPEGLASAAIGTLLGQGFAPGMVWNADGTLLLYSAASQSAEAYRLEMR